MEAEDDTTGAAAPSPSGGKGPGAAALRPSTRRPAPAASALSVPRARLFGLRPSAASAALEPWRSVRCMAGPRDMVVTAPPADGAFLRPSAAAPGREREGQVAGDGECLEPPCSPGPQAPQRERGRSGDRQRRPPVSALNPEFIPVPEPSGQPWVLLPVGRAVHSGVDPALLALPWCGPRVLGALAEYGSDLVCDLPVVSRRHARLELVQSVAERGALRCAVTDLGSTNGTFVNGVRLQPFRDFFARPGDTISLGSAQVSFQLGRLPEGAQAMTVQEELGDWLACEPTQQPDWGAPGRGETVAACHHQGVLEEDCARLLIRQGRLPEARAMLQAGLEDRTGPAAGPLLSQWAALERRARRPALARVLYRAALDVLCQQQGSGPVAIRNPAVTAMPGDGWVGHERVRTLRSWALLEAEQQNDTSARRLFLRALWEAERAPGGAVAAGGVKSLVSWASWELSRRARGRAHELVRRALGMAGARPPPELLLVEGQVLAALGDGEGARAALLRGLELHPGHAALLHRLAKLEADLGRGKEARRAFGQLLAADPDNVHALHVRARGYGMGRSAPSPDSSFPPFLAVLGSYGGGRG